MKKFLRWAIGIIVVLLVVAGVVLIFMDQIIKGVAVRRIRAQTGMEARIGELNVKLGSGSLRIKDFQLLNPPQFGNSPMLVMPELFMEMDQEAARSGKLRFKEVRLHLSEFNLIKDKKGKFNVEGIEKIAKTNKTSSGSSSGKSLEFGGIEKLYLTLGTLNYTDLGSPERNEVLKFDVQNEVFTHLQTEEDVKTWYGALCVRLVLQMLTQEMINNPEHTQSFEETLKELGSALKDL
jgi:uncharacterized protein involved in outer membrane biogenesis